MPMMPFIGVRISWLMVARNWLFARLAASDASRACIIARRIASRSLTMREMVADSSAISPLLTGASPSCQWPRPESSSRRASSAFSRDASSSRKLPAVRLRSSKVGRNSSGTSAADSASISPFSVDCCSKSRIRSRALSHRLSGNQISSRPPAKPAKASQAAETTSSQMAPAMLSTAKVSRRTP